MDALAKDKPLTQQTYINSSLLHPLVYISTNAKDKPDSDGIFIYRLNTVTGELTHVSSTKAGESPSYIAIDKHRRYLYATNRNNDGGLRSFEINQKNGNLTFLNEQPCPGGPCHVVVDHANKVALTANYHGGSVAVFPIQQDNGHLAPYSDFKQHHGSSVNKDRQEGPHAHYITTDFANKYVFVADLGQDKIIGYRLDNEKGVLIPNDPPVAFSCKPGSGPRHLDFHPNGRIAYLIHEMGSIMTVLAYDGERGVFTELQTLPTLPEGWTGENKTAAVHVLPNGKFVYGSNRGHDSIVVYEIEEDTGKLTFVEHVPTEGKEPRDFTIDLTGNYLIVANQDSDSIFTYKIDHQTGKLTKTGYKIEVPAPSCLKVIPDFAD